MKSKLLEIFQDVFNQETDIEKINSNHSNWDSLAHLNLILSLEEEFRISIPPEDFQLLHSDMQTIIQYLQTHPK